MCLIYVLYDVSCMYDIHIYIYLYHEDIIYTNTYMLYVRFIGNICMYKYVIYEIHNIYIYMMNIYYKNAVYVHM